MTNPQLLTLIRIQVEEEKLETQSSGESFIESLDTLGSFTLL